MWAPTGLEGPLSDRPRLFFLDNLRAVAIVLVIVLHASITSMLYGPAWSYVVDPDQDVAFTWVVLLVDVPILPALFLARARHACAWPRCLPGA